MTPAEGLATFAHALHVDFPSRIVISTAPLGARLRKWVPGKPETSARSSQPPSHARPAIATEFVAPRNEIEGTIAGIWEELLGIDRVGAHDDFFALGGHSLFAARVLSRLKEAFAVSLPLAAIFDRPTVAGLAERVQAVLWLARSKPQAAAPSPPGASDERVEVEL
jgi:acyl carrier protein